MRVLTVAMLAVTLGVAPLLSAEEAGPPPEDWFDSLITETPADGFALAIRLARRSVTTIQTDKTVLHQQRAVYSVDGEQLIAASGVVAAYFQTVAEANNYWRGEN